MPVKKMQPLEKKYGKPMAAILADLYTLLGDHQLVANQLNVTMKTLWQWRKELGCETVVRLACDIAPAPSGEARAVRGES